MEKLNGGEVQLSATEWGRGYGIEGEDVEEVDGNGGCRSLAFMAAPLENR